MCARTQTHCRRHRIWHIDWRHTVDVVKYSNARACKPPFMYFSHSIAAALSQLPRCRRYPQLFVYKWLQLTCVFYSRCVLAGSGGAVAAAAVDHWRYPQHIYSNQYRREWFFEITSLSNCMSIVSSSASSNYISSNSTSCRKPTIKPRMNIQHSIL